MKRTDDDDGGKMYFEQEKEKSFVQKEIILLERLYL